MLFHFFLGYLELFSRHIECQASGNQVRLFKFTDVNTTIS